MLNQPKEIEKLCKNCKYWGNYKKGGFHQTESLKNGNVCGSPKTHFARTITNQIKDGYDKDCFESFLLDDNTQEQTKSDEISCLDGSGYWGAIYTGQEFGCVNFDSKEKKI